MLNNKKQRQVFVFAPLAALCLCSIASAHRPNPANVNGPIAGQAQAGAHANAGRQPVRGPAMTSQPAGSQRNGNNLQQRLGNSNATNSGGSASSTTPAHGHDQARRSPNDVQGGTASGGQASPAGAHSSAQRGPAGFIIPSTTTNRITSTYYRVKPQRDDRPLTRF